MQTGRIKSYDASTGWGVLTAEEGKDTYFRSAPTDPPLGPGDDVVFDVRTTFPRGPEVVNLERTRRAPDQSAERITTVRPSQQITTQSRSSHTVFRIPVRRPGPDPLVAPAAQGPVANPDPGHYITGAPAVGSENTAAASELAARAAEARAAYLAALDAKQKRNYHRARSLFERAIRLGTTDTAVYTAYAAMEKGLQDFARARAVFEKAITNLPPFGKFYEDYGMLEKKQGNLVGAATLFRKGLESDPDYKALHGHLGQTLLAIGLPWALAEAESHLELAKRYGYWDQATEFSYKLLKVLRGHPRGRLAVEFFNRLKFDIVQITPHAVNTYATDFLVRCIRPEYEQSYDLVGDLFMRCYYKATIDYDDIKQLLSKFSSTDSLDRTNRDVIFVILNSAAQVRDSLFRILESPGKNPVIVPLEESDVSASIHASEHESLLRRVLDEWLYRRDLYKGNVPVSGRKFFGREQELAELLKNVDTGNHTGIFGLRKVGKTSLLKQLKEKRQSDLVIYLDLLATPPGVQDTKYLYWEIANQLHGEVLLKRRDLAHLPFRLGGKTRIYSEVDQNNIALDFDHDLRMILRELPGKVNHQQKVLILMDELEKILPIPNVQPGFGGYIDLFSYIRGVSQQQDGLVSIITAANPSVCEDPTWAGIDNPVFKFYQELFLPPLERDECDEMIIKLGRGMGLSYTEPGLQMIYTQTGGHPFVSRQLCSRIVALNKSRPLLVRELHVMEAADAFLREDTATFAEILSRLDQHFPHEKTLLLAVVQGCDTDAALAALAPATMQSALRHLVGYQLIERLGTRYRVKMRLLDEWLKLHWIGVG